MGGFSDNIWVGTTIDTQKRVRVAERSFANIEAKFKWLSCEPMLERLTFNKLDMFDQMVIGGASPSSKHQGFSLSGNGFGILRTKPERLVALCTLKRT